MKKTLTYLLVVVALVALASTASAVTCTIDQHPAATLLVPYFQVHLNHDGSADTSPTGADTLVTIVNASDRATLAHVVVWNRRSVPVLDFNIALTAFDEEAFSMAEILSTGNGHLPSTPSLGTKDSGLSGSGFAGKEVCQRNSSATVFPDSDGFLRFRPIATPFGTDNSQATTQYGAPIPAAYLVLLQDVLDYDDSEDCPDLLHDSGDGDIASDPNATPGNGNLSGYITIDMSNYCTLSDPLHSIYWEDDAAGWENNLWGDYILVSNSGIPTLGAPTVQIEAALDTVFIASDGSTLSDNFVAPPSESQPFNEASSEGPVERTFYARYWEDPVLGNTGDSGTIQTTNPVTSSCPTNTSCSEQDYMNVVFPFVSRTFGDEREPLGVRYGARYLNDGTLSSSFRVWRASSDGLKDLTGDTCSDTEVNILAAIFDTDENTQQINGCPSPCPQTFINFPYETQRVDAGSVIGGLVQNGWIYINFLGSESGDDIQNLDQAWIDYEMSAGAAFVNASVSAVQLDPSTCNPAGLIVNPPSSSPGTPGDIFPMYAWPVGLGH